MKKSLSLTLVLITIFAAFLPSHAQEPTAQQPAADEAAEQKAVLEKNAYRLLDQVIDESQSLRLPENRVRIQINAADLLWDRNQERARSLFQQASDGVSDLVRSAATVSTSNQRGGPPDRRAFALRQELVLAAARHDAPLAYQLLVVTKAPAPTSIQNPPGDARNPRIQFNPDDSLEQTLLGRIAALDPKLAAQNAEQMMEKGQFPRSLGEVINQLQRQDSEAAAKLADKTVKRIQAANILTNNDAANLAQSLLSAGPRVTTNAGTTASTEAKPQPQTRGPVLEPSVYTDLLSTVIDSAMKATPQPQNNQRNQGRGPGGGGNRGQISQQQNNQPAQPTDAQIEQNNARRLLGALQAALPSIDQLLPGRSAAVRQKLTELGLSDTSRSNFAQTMSTLQQGNPNADALVQAAAVAPPPMQSRLYQQAADKALEEGNADRARQIATDHLQAGARDSVMQRIDFREMARKAVGAKLDGIRQNLARLSSETEKVSLLLQIANDLQKDNPNVQRQLLEEARQVVSHRASNYDQFEDQLRVARAFAALDSARSFEILETGIMQLNELLSAAAVLSGFEVNIFRDGEMSMTNQGGSGLNSTINRYGQELAVLAKTDFGRSEALAGRFQFTEPRIMARLSIIQGALGVAPSQPNINTFRNFGFANTVARPE
jgi:ABC-type transporter MlaC component